MGLKISLPLPQVVKRFTRLRRERVRINFGGKVYIAFTVLVGIAAVNTGNNILYILLSFLLALMGISGLLSRYNLSGLKAYLVPPDEVWCCRPATFRVRLENRKYFPAFLVEVFERSIGLHKLFPMVERTEEEGVRLTFPKRGVYRMNALEGKSTFPFGLFERSFSVPLEEEILVYPKPIEVKVKLPLSKPRRGKGESFLHFRRSGEGAVEGIKEYAGEGMRLIHWKAFAKLGELYAKEVAEETFLREVIVDMDKIPASDKEERISKATYLVLHFSRLGYAVGLKYGEREIPPAAGREHLRELLKFLALL